MDAIPRVTMSQSLVSSRTRLIDLGDFSAAVVVVVVVMCVRLNPIGDNGHPQTHTHTHTHTERERERERETERQRQRETERDRETDRQTDRDRQTVWLLCKVHGHCVVILPCTVSNTLK